jgi:hypothetical protein
MPPPIVNHRRDIPSEPPTISLALLHQVGGIPGAPGAGAPRVGPPVDGTSEAVLTEYGALS